MPSKYAVMRPGDGPTVVPGTSWTPPIPPRPLPRREGGPLPPQPGALWSPRSAYEENLVYIALVAHMDDSVYGSDVRSMLAAMDEAQARRRGESGSRKRD